jgi:hypothetical protein
MCDQEIIDVARLLAKDGSWLKAVEARCVDYIDTPRGRRKHIGHRHWRLDTGEGLRPLGTDLFEISATGEILERV